MEKFLGRENELKILQKFYDKNSFNMAAIYGRRRIGKTMLINHFMHNQGCKKISFTAVEQNEKVLLSLMKEAVLRELAPELLNVIDFTDFDKLFEFIGEYAKKDKLIFFIDEYPYLAKQCPYIQSVLQKHIDTNWKNTNMFFIICGSLIGFMKDEVIARSAPLHGRSNLELKLRPFDYRDTALFLDGYSLEEKAVVYGLTDGVAKYITQFDTSITLDENIINQFFTAGGYFSEEQIKTVVTGDRLNPALYNSIISAIASGCTRNNEICNYVGSDDITYPLNILAKAEIIEKRYSKNPYYVINDSMLTFWFRYVNRAISLINVGNGARYYETNVKDKLHDFMGAVFEKMAKEYLLKNSGFNNIPLMTEISDYQNSFKNKEGNIINIEIDLCGKENKNIVLIGECKFKNEKFDKNELISFRNKVNYLNADNAYLCIFSLSGYTDYVKENAGNIRLYTIEDMYQ